MPSPVLRQAPAAALFVVSTASTAIGAVVLEAHRRQPAYAMPGTVVLLAGLCVAATAAGGLLAVRRGQVAPWLAPLVVFGLLVGFIEAGTLILVAVVALGLLGARLLPATGGRAPDRRGAGAAALLSLGLVPIALLLLLGRPVVECLPHGVASATPIWAWFGNVRGSGSMSSQSGGGSGSSTDPARSDGVVTNGGATYTYTCEGDSLVRFSATEAGHPAGG